MKNHCQKESSRRANTVFFRSVLCKGSWRRCLCGGEVFDVAGVTAGRIYRCVHGEERSKTAAEALWYTGIMRAAETLRNGGI